MTAVPLLDISDLTVEFMTRRGLVTAVKQVNVSVAKGETVGIVGESGSGKSVTSYAVMRILDRAGRIADGSVSFSGLDLRTAPEHKMRDLRGREMSMIFQNPRSALNPIRKVGHQIEDVLRQHAQAGSQDAREKAIAALTQVKIARPEERYHAYPFELSGGMCQRIVIALALACRPQLLIADEPTTGLDVTTQKAVMDLIVDLTRERGMSTILITHDLGLAATYCDKVIVMEKGRVVETARSADIFRTPAHEYTRKLMRATPRPGITLRDLLPEGTYPASPAPASPPSPVVASSSAVIASSSPVASPSAVIAGHSSAIATPSPVIAGLDPAIHQSSEDSSTKPMDPRVKPGGDSKWHDASGALQPLLVVEGLVKDYPRQGVTRTMRQLFGGAPKNTEDTTFRAVDNVSFEVRRGESVGLVGESGCGKSTTSTMVMRLLDATAGRITLNGQDISAIPARSFARHKLRPKIQMVFQDPTDSLNPRHTAARAIADPILRFQTAKGAKAVRARCEELATMVGLPLDLLDRLPHQLSGGQKARVGIARAIALNPELVILDEPTAALDVSVQALVLNLLADLKSSLGMSYLFVSHDLHVVRLLCDRVIVMKSGCIIEQGTAAEVLENPQTDYTRELIAAIPHPPV